MHSLTDMISFSQEINAREIATVATLADEMWNAHYVPIIYHLINGIAVHR